MIKVTIKIRVEKHPIQPPGCGFHLIGERYQILVDGMRAGVYYDERRELALEKIPTWLPGLSRQIKKEVEKVLKVKVKETTQYR